MPIIRDYALPSSAKDLKFPDGPDSTFYLLFISSDDAETGQPWCPDVRASLPTINATFSGDAAPKIAFIQVGQKPEWKDPENVYRTQWKIRGVPTLARFQVVDGEVRQVGAINEDGILDEKTFREFLA